MTRDVFVISPFADVAAELRRKLEGYFAKDTAGDRIGTVHVTQGKEADIVVFVLGTGADADGSRNWASERPNLLNVALTRAVKRLVVIGDYDLWGRTDGFDVLARNKHLVKWRSRYTPDPFTI